MQPKCVFIVIDSGFSLDSMSSARVLAAWDLVIDRKFLSETQLSASQLRAFSGDPLGHGTIVLQRLLKQAPDAALILVKAFGSDGRLRRTGFRDGRVSRAGWTEAYLWAVREAERRAMPSVACLSFGSYHHAMDGSGWEANQLRSVTGPGKPGHIVVAAAGPGDARACHAAVHVLPGQSRCLEVDQYADSDYNFWFGLRQAGPDLRKHWQLHASLNGRSVFKADSLETPLNFWNQRQQLNFRIQGSGKLEIELYVSGSGVYSEMQGTPADSLRVDAWTEDARFRNWICPDSIPEPACFDFVIAAGLATGSYAPGQELPGVKPEVLLPGSGQISFRLPELSSTVAALLSAEPKLDAKELMEKLPKFV